MSTRSIIGTANYDRPGFTGRYCHYDGYPTCKGAQLLATYNELGNAQAVIEYAVKPGALGYWSSYNVPSKVAADALLPEKVPCNLCAGTGNRTDMTLHKPNWCNGCDGSGQMRNPDVAESFRTDNGDSFATSEDGWGAEWAYLLDEDGITVMVNASAWTKVASVGWKDAPDWKAIETRGDKVR